MGGYGPRRTNSVVGGWGLATLAVALLANPWGLGVILRSDPSGPARTLPAKLSLNIAAPNLTVQFPLEGGSDAPRVAVRADWGAPPGGCTLVPSWFDWFLPRSPVP
ncbi:MAG: hypothetical protein L3K10_03090, partial [Thermoplasmata archaeon]|nr:hypothetical protein [Thermoplasmata archaeon]